LDASEREVNVDTLSSLLFLSALVLVLVLFLAVLPLFSKMLASRTGRAGAHPVSEGGCLMVVAFGLILIILLWRAA
jgi:hypothetical protein